MSVFEAIDGRPSRAGWSARVLRMAWPIQSSCGPVRAATGLMLIGVWALAPMAATAQSSTPTTVYRCPGNPVLYTDALTPQEARERGCTTIEGAPVTVVQTRRPQPAAAPPAQAGGGAAARDAQARVDPAAQRARDTDARRILGAELQREQARLAELQREYNNGEPERRGDERNYQRYLDRVADLRVNIARQEANIAALQRELSRLPQ